MRAFGCSVAFVCSLQMRSLTHNTAYFVLRHIIMVIMPRIMWVGVGSFVGTQANLAVLLIFVLLLVQFLFYYN